MIKLGIDKKWSHLQSLPVVTEWLKTVEDKLNDSEKLGRAMSDLFCFGSSSITVEEIVEELSSKKFPGGTDVH